jgi:hypothetical protein
MRREWRMRVAAVNLLETRSAYRMLVEKCYENCHLEDRVGGGRGRITLRTILDKYVVRTAGGET